MAKPCRYKRGPNKGRFKKCAGKGKKRKTSGKKRSPKNCAYKMSITKPQNVFKVASKMYNKAGRPSGKWQVYVKKAWKCYRG
jgi:hypothetical protein